MVHNFRFLIGIFLQPCTSLSVLYFYNNMQDAKYNVK